MSSQGLYHEVFLNQLVQVWQSLFLQKNCEGEDRHTLKSKVANGKLRWRVEVNVP